MKKLEILISDKYIKDTIRIAKVEKWPLDKCEKFLMEWVTELRKLIKENAKL